MSTTASRLKQIKRHLHEQIPVVSSRVTRGDKVSIIHGVKLSGRTSPNRHGLNVDGTEYTRQAFESAVGLYDGAKIKADHPPRSEPNKERSIKDTMGKIQNVVVREGDLYGDLHVLNSHPMTGPLLDSAEAMPDLFTMSHNADGVGHVENGKYVITKIVRVNSVDVVDRGATTRSLFESDRTGKKGKPMKSKKTLCESLKDAGIDEKTRLRLFEMDLGLTPAMATPEKDEEGTSDWKDHIGKAILAILADANLDGNGMRDKIMKVLDALAEPAAAVPDAIATMGDAAGDVGGAADLTEEGNDETGMDDLFGGDDDDTEDDDSDVSDSGEDDDPEDDDEDEDEELTMKESKELAALRREKKARQLCESLNFQPSTIDLEAVAALESEEKQKALIQRLSGTASSKGGAKSSAHRNVQESQNGHENNRLLKMLG